MTAEPQISTASITIHDDESALGAVLLRIRLLAQRRLRWLATSLDHGAGSEIDALIDDRDDPAAEVAWQRDQDDLSAQIAAVEAALVADSGSRLAQLLRVFALDAFDRDLLHVCLAVALDPALARLYAYCHDDARRAYPTLALTARLCGYGRFAAWPPTSPLKRWEMIHLLPDSTSGDQLAALQLDPAIRDWLNGGDDPDPLLVGRAHMVLALQPLPEWDVDAAATFAANALADNPSRTVVIQVVAPPGSGRKTFAACVAAQLGMALLVIDATAIGDDAWESTFIHVQRDAFLQRIAPAWSDNASEHNPPRRWSERVTHFPVQFLLRDAVALATSVPNAIVLRVDLPAPGVATRRRLWAQYAPQAAELADQLNGLAERFNALPGAIVAATGVPGASIEHMARALRDSRRDLLGGLAQPLDSHFGWDDLVVTDALREALRDFVHEATDRALFWEQPEARRLFPQGRGLATLFSGSPGTGKTMAAQVVAAQLGLDLFRVDLSTVVSKYVGETSHNLQRILSRAADMDVVLFFDEADALFSRRTEVKDAHDRFANTDTNHLLQALESYGGIAILATNRKGNIDPAFIRRLRYVLEFARPDAGQRRRLWTRMIGALAGAEIAESLHTVIERLATELDLTGAQIKYAVLTGVFAARRDGVALEAKHIMRGLDREMAKEGRALSDRERARLR